jgi:hypothetical protein
MSVGHSVENKVRVLSEGLARTIGRRKFLQQVSATVFAGMAALVAGHVMGGRAWAGAAPGSPMPIPQVPQCAPPGPYCNLDGNRYDPNGCHGGSCFQHRHNGQVLQCRVYYQWYQAGCWTTYVTGGYWTCCDCECGTPRVASCGCAQFSSQPYPRPDNPLGESNA